MRERGRGTEVVVHVQHVGQERLGGTFLQVKLLHLVLHHDGLAGDLLTRARHAKEPRNPLKEHRPHLRQKRWPSRIVVQSIVALMSQWQRKASGRARNAFRQQIISDTFR